MLERKVWILNKLGLHARASARFATEASRFKSDVFLRKGEIEVNGKSIMGIMMLAASKGTELIIRTNGEDEADAMDALVRLVENRFGEES